MIQTQTVSPIFKLLIYLVFFQGFTQAADLPYIFAIKQITAIHPHSFILRDLDHDSRDEVLYNIPQKGEHNIIYLEDNLLSINWSLNFEDAVASFEACDYDGDGSDEIFVLQKLDSIHVLKVFDLQRQLLLRDTIFIGDDLNRDGECDVDLSYKHFVDLNQDGNLDILFMVHSGFDYRHRGLLAYDVKNRKRLWYHQTGGSPMSTVLEDLDGDGISEIIIGTNSPSNGNVTATTDDSHSYLQVLNLSGKLLWQRMIGETSFSDIMVGSVRSSDDLQLAVISVLLGHGNSNAPNKIIAWTWECDTRQLVEQKEVDIHTRLSSATFLGNPNAPDWRVIVQTTTGEVYVYDREFKLQKEFESKRHFRIIGRDNYIPNMPDTYAIWTKAEGVGILSTDFECLAHYPEATDIRRLTTGPYDQHKFLLVTPLAIDLVDLTENTHAFSRFTRGETLSFLLGVMITILAFLSYSRLRRHHIQHKTWSTLLNRLPFGILLLDAQQRILFANRLFITWLGLPEDELIGLVLSSVTQLERLGKYALDPEQATDSGTLTLTHDTVSAEYSIKSFTLPAMQGRHHLIRCISLENITLRNRASSTLEWAAVMQRIAHSIRNPLDILGKQMRRLRKILKQESVDAGQADLALVDSMLEEIQRLEETTKTFLVFSRLQKRENQPIDNQEILVKLVEKYRTLVADSYQLVYKSHRGRMIVSGDAKQLEQAYENLIENALSAMPEGGLLKIETLQTEHISGADGQVSEQLSIRFSDEGHGIEENMLQNIFRPGISRRSGGAGFGLFISKQIIEDHGGSIEIRSKVNSGTTVEVNLTLKPVIAEGLSRGNRTLMI